MIPAPSTSSRSTLLQRWCDNFGHADAEVVIEHQDLPPRYQPSIYEDVDWVAGQLVERNDRSRLQLQDFFDQQFRPSKLDPQIKFDVLQSVQADAVAGRVDRLVERFKFVRCGGSQ